MKILYVITGLGVGGAERQVVDVADKLVESGYSVAIAYLTGSVLTKPKSDKIRLLGLEINKKASSLVCGYLKLKKIIVEYRPDVVHSHMVHANLFTRLVRISCGMPKLICTAHSSNEGGKLRMIAYRLTDFLADISTNVSAEAVAAFEAAGAVKPGRMISVHNGIDTDRFSPSLEVRQYLRQLHGVRNSEKIIIAVGRLNVAKDYPNLLHAFAYLCQARDDVKLWVVGDGELRSELEALAKNLNVDERISFFGIQSNVAEWMNAADVFVLSSAWEGFGLVVAEAMACEKIVIATDSGGVKEVVGDCGFVVPIRDSLALSNALKNAISLPSKDDYAIAKMARKRIIENFSLNSTVEKWIKLYQSE